VQDLVRLEAPPQVFVCASASGYFGDRGGELLLEDSAPGNDFLAEVCKAWEAAAAGAEAFCQRVVTARFGVVLAANGGALQRIVPIFKLGLGGKLGNGEQYFPWISLDDAVDALAFLVDHPTAAGAYHLVGQEAVTNAEFTRALGKQLHRPTFIPAPALSLRLVLGEVAEALLLSSARMATPRLLEAGFVHRHAKLRSALAALF
jgi:uncharacterized protein (TIGR01777 family)